MRKYTIVCLLIIPLFSPAQTSPAGKYRNYSGERIEIYPDSSFTYTWHFDINSSWSKGKWTVKGTIISFQFIPVYDTIRITNANGGRDSLLLSADDHAERIISQAPPVRIDSIRSIKLNLEAALNSGGQNIHPFPGELIIKRNKLYPIRNGKKYSKKQKGFWSNKKWPAYYFKTDEK